MTSWWAKFFKKGFRHVYAIRWMGDYWIRLETYLGYSDVTILPYEGQSIETIVDPQCSAILHVKQWRDMYTLRAPWVLGPITCVEQIKSLLGLGAFHIITPYQLYKYLKDS